jgi:hypothetical protein
MLRRLTVLGILAAGQVLVATACGDDPTSPPSPGPPRQPSMVVVSGSDQMANVGTTLPPPLVVRIRDSLDAPARGIVVRLSSHEAVARTGAVASDPLT